MAVGQTRPLKGSFHPNNTGPTARLTARHYRARLDTFFMTHRLPLSRNEIQNRFPITASLRNQFSFSHILFLIGKVC